MNRLKQILRSKRFAIPAGVLAAYTLAGFFLVPALVRYYVPRIAADTFHRPAAIGEVRFNPFVFTFEANDFSLSERDGAPIVGLKRLFVDFELKSLFKWAWTFRTIRLEGPRVNAVVDPDGTLNLAKLAARDPDRSAPPPEQKGKEPPRVIVEEIVFDQGEIGLTDRRQAEPATIALKPLQLDIRNLTTLPDQQGNKVITASTLDGETLRWSGHIRLNPVVSKGTFEIEKLRAASLWEFGRDALNLDAPAGTVALRADYTLDLSREEPDVTVTNLALVVEGLVLKLTGADAPFLELPDARVMGVGLDLARRSVNVQQIAVRGGRARLRVDENGVMNVQQTARETGPASSPTAEAPAAGDSGKPWMIALGELDFGGFALDYRDASRSPGLTAGIGSVGVRLKADAAAGAGPFRLQVADAAVALKGLKAGFTGSAETPLAIESVALEGAAYDLGANALTLSRLSVERGALDLRREADGALNLALLFAPPRTGAIAREREEAAAAGRAFQFLAKEVSVSGLQASVSDLGVKPDGPLVNVTDVAVTLNDVDGESPMRFDAALALTEGGRIRASGTVAPELPSVEAQVEVAGLALPPFQPFVDRALAAALTSGTFSVKGTLRHGVGPSGPQTAFQGGFSVDDLRLVETGRKDTLVGWKSLQTEQLTLELEPNRLDIGDLKLVRPAGKFIIEKDQSINLAGILKTDPAAKKDAAPAKPGAPGTDPFPYRVRRVLVSGGEVDFADLSLITPFGTRIHELKGVVAGVSSTRNARAQVKLDGRVDAYGTAKVDGELNASDPKAFTNIGLAFRNVEMSRLSPYSGQFAGRKIDSGKLTVDLKYRVERSKLKGDNRLVVERLKLGDKVKSPEAVDLPLDLAVALLSDSNGVIDLGLPVSGDLDSPEFSYGALIWKALVNILTKVVTSPFRALGALLPGGGEDGFDAITFDAGRPELPAPEREKLAQLAGALQKRPQLTLKVQGRWQPMADRAELQSAAVRRALAAQMKRPPETADEPVDFGSPEIAKAIEALFAQRLGADALKALKSEAAARAKAAKDAAAKTPGAAPPADDDPGRFLKDLLGRIERAEPVDDPALVRLADARAQAVVTELQSVGQVAAERLSTMPSTAVENADDPPGAKLGLEAK